MVVIIILLLINKLLNILLVTKMIKKIRALCVSFPKINTNRSFDENNCMYFMIEEEKFLINEIWEKVGSIIKKN